MSVPPATDGEPGVPAPPAGSPAGSPTPPVDLLEELELAVDPLTEATSLAPSPGVASAGGTMLPLPHDAPNGREPGAETFRSGLFQAGPVAVAGLIANGASALIVVVVAHMVSPRAYGAIAQLLGLFFILAMPGSAVLVAVVRRVAALDALGQRHHVRRWAGRIHRLLLALVVVELVVVWLLQGWIARQLSLPDDQGVVLILVSGGIWILLCVDRGLLQAHRDYRSLAGNLLVEGGVRTVCVIGFVAAGMGVSGYALGIFVCEVVATVHARWLAARAWPVVDQPEAAVAVAVAPAAVPAPNVAPVANGTADGVTDVARAPVVDRRVLVADLVAAFVGLALLGLLQNVDVILLGRLDHTQAGPYAAISQASKALVFGAIALGAYLLPEATIRWNAGGHAVRQLVVTLTFLAVPAVVLLGIALAVPQQFLTLVFGAKLATAAPAFAALVGAMIFLCLSVLLTNYLFGAGARWIVLLLLAGSVLAVVLVWAAGGHPVATARADLVVQAVLAVAISVSFVVIHHRQHGSRWFVAHPPQRVSTALP